MIRETAWLVGLVGLLLAGVVFAFFELPYLVVSPEDLQTEVSSPTGLKRATAPTAVDLVQARNGARTAAVALIAGIAGALATGFAGRTYYLSRRGQLNERYTTAVEQLEAAEPAVQVSAIGELERIARESPSRHRQIMAVLTTFLRSQKLPEDADEAPAGVQRACSVLADRRTRYDHGLVLDLAGADLRRIIWDGAPLRAAVLRDAKLAGAFLRDADLREANLTNAIAPSVRLDNAKLGNAILEGADLAFATLDSAEARGAAFGNAQLNHTSLRSADLREATGLPLTEGKVTGAVLDENTKLAS